jgi:hypothetical protein
MSDLSPIKYENIKPAEKETEPIPSSFSKQSYQEAFKDNKTGYYGQQYSFNSEPSSFSKVFAVGIVAVCAWLIMGILVLMLQNILGPMFSYAARPISFGEALLASGVFMVMVWIRLTLDT